MLDSGCLLAGLSTPSPATGAWSSLLTLAMPFGLWIAGLCWDLLASHQKPSWSGRISEHIIPGTHLEGSLNTSSQVQFLVLLGPHWRVLTAPSLRRFWSDPLPAVTVSPASSLTCASPQPPVRLVNAGVPRVPKPPRRWPQHTWRQSFQTWEFSYNPVYEMHSVVYSIQLGEGF